jgi:signal transduction histidine kinase
LAVEFDAREVPDGLDADTALCLYRLAQEALQNVVKHSFASRAAVVLLGESESIWLRIADDGKGFDLESLKGHEGLGLVGMRERLRLVGGEIGIESKPGSGTQISARLPIHGPFKKPAPKSAASGTSLSQ